MNNKPDAIGVLREAVETVAAEIETGRRPDHLSRRMLIGTAAAVVASFVLIAGLLFEFPADNPEVRVMELKIDGRPVEARVMDGKAPATIIVIPERPGQTPLVSASVMIGGGK